MSLARSMARSCVRKQEREERAILDSCVWILSTSFFTRLVASIATSIPSWKHWEAAR